MFNAICGLFGILLVIYVLVGAATLVFNVCMSLGVVGLVILVAMAVYGLKWIYSQSSNTEFYMGVLQEYKKSPTRSVNTGGGIGQFVVMQWGESVFRLVGDTY